MKKELINAVWDLNEEKVATMLNTIGGDFFKKDNMDGENPLLLAAQLGATNIVRLLLDHSFDVNHQEESGSTALMWAALAGKEETVKFLLEKNAYVNQKDNAGITPLLMAVMRGKEKVVSLLISHGADVEATDKQGMNALMWASMIQRHDIVSMLIDSGADTERVFQNGMSSMMRLVLKESIERAQHLKSDQMPKKITSFKKGKGVDLLARQNGD